MQRTGVSAVLSLLLHAVPLLVLRFVAQLPLLVAPLPIEIRAAHALVQRRAPEDRRGDPRAEAEPKTASRPAAPPRPATATAKVTKPRVHHGPATQKAKLPADEPAPPPPATADLRPVGPSDARIVILLRTDRLRASPHRASVETLLEALPDYRTLLGGTGLTPVENLDALLIATANPYDVTATFLAARHADEARIHEALLARTLPSWDPRVLRFVEPGLSVLTRPDGADRIDRARASEERLLGEQDGGVLVDEGTRLWFAELRRFERFAEEPGAPTVLVTISDVPSLARLSDGLPTPQSAALAATAEAAPALRLTLRFASELEAARFETEWPAVRQRFRHSTAILGLSSMLDGLVLARTPGSPLQVELAGRIPDLQMRLALSWASALLPRPPEAVAPDATPSIPSSISPSIPAGVGTSGSLDMR